MFESPSIMPAATRSSRVAIRAALCILAPTIIAGSTGSHRAQAQATTSRTLVALLAHADDEAPIAPLIARYAREGVKIFWIIASDGSEGGGPNRAVARADTGVRGEQLTRMRNDEARCSADALGAQPPIFLGFPDGKLGDFIGDRSLLYRLTDRVAQELERLRPDVIVTWGPDGGVGHPDHRMVSNIATQLMRAGAPGVPERLFYMYLPAEGIRAMNPQRGAPPLLIPQDKYFTVHVSFTPADLEAGRRSMVCHRSQYPPEIIERVFPVQQRVWNGVVALIPAFPTAPLTDLFK